MGALDWADMLLVIADHPWANAGSFRNVAAAHPEKLPLCQIVFGVLPLLGELLVGTGKHLL